MVKKSVADDAAIKFPILAEYVFLKTVEVIPAITLKIAIASSSITFRSSPTLPIGVSSVAPLSVTKSSLNIGATSAIIHLNKSLAPKRELGKNYYTATTVKFISISICPEDLELIVAPGLGTNAGVLSLSLLPYKETSPVLKS